MRPFIIIAIIGAALMAAYFMIPPITFGEHGHSGYYDRSTLTDEEILREKREMEEAIKQSEEFNKKMDAIKARQKTSDN